MKRLNVILSLSIAAMFVFSAVASEQEAPKDFTLKPIFGEKPFQLSKAKGKYVAIHFLLKTECPICLRHVRAYFEHEKDHSDVIQLYVKPDTPGEIKAWASKIPQGDMEKAPEIYHDPDAKLAKQFGVPGGYKFHGQVVHFPAFVLLDPNGKEVFRYVGKNNSERYSYEKFVKKMEELKS
ncbi:MAG: TlpA disulfide reductase family protein [Candidatus Hinthialibacter antarcticus]|nr:TlpA disulfide reductase family protein [Candidatus Hinthialibacter antarcticus]